MWEISWNEENSAKNMIIVNNQIVWGALYTNFYEHGQIGQIERGGQF